MFGLRRKQEERRNTGKTLHRTQSLRSLHLARDLEMLELPSNVVLDFPNKSDIREFDVVITVEDGIWQGGSYKFHFTFPPNYRDEAPRVMCHTPIWHPNIDMQGHICLNILRDTEWSAAMNLQSVIFGLLLLFHDPNPDDPLNQDAAREMKMSQSSFQAKIRRTLRGGRIDGHTYNRMPGVSSYY
eukprot:gnl/Trimastix_PCT/3379.p1 GENE.gnl/Trimastix_PCT/3379~~gnl/Trimastix_PCT/3379.p1  ORF type:complete len:185 (+),score=14.94 gnl/Trimastix_PCT/3379:102-656(+)